MTRAHLPLCAALALLPAVAIAQSSPEAPASDPVKSLLQSCDAHKFETSVHLIVNGVPKESKVRLCGTEGQSDADWIKTLKDAVEKTEANPQMARAVKDQIVAAVNREVDRLSAATVVPSGDPTLAPRTPPQSSLSRDYAALPPLPTAPTVAPPNLLGTAGGAASVASGTPAAPLLSPARLSLRCAAIGDEDRASRCSSIDKDSVLVLRADAAFPGGVAVRFVRRGDTRAELSLPPLKAGQTAAVRLPPAVCAGVVHSKIEIQAGGGDRGPGIGTVGEYDLNC